MFHAIVTDIGFQLTTLAYGGHIHLDPPIFYFFEGRFPTPMCTHGNSVHTDPFHHDGNASSPEQSWWKLPYLSRSYGSR
ncbi:hypothetical protein CGMCC3_g7337 [Colletotrichum fructicola]|nr:uncharacterized protein CGMCC3_g7337 [Colletotrichum fructicola]KAE9576331.1 hypothetical protein CGMCC3_g7337 [Colletotrichum fructicola]KAF4430010.1 hypothetical protein CFRS1_v011045 [Colletotrichum fructicola]KAF5509054.1 hypothetical protein CGCF413_v003822 [Colletotrichum fructicola]